MKELSKVLAITAYLLGGCHSFPRESLTTSHKRAFATKSHELQGGRSNDDFDGHSTDSNTRRAFLGATSAAASIFFLGNSPANAKDEIFRPNPLTNAALEQIRIWEQAEADNIKYGGELEAGDAGNKGKVGAYPRLLAPILKIDQELAEVNSLVRDSDKAKAWPKALAILQDEKYEKIKFKKTFNQYGDNIYYSDPDRANLYLGGGATPKTEQSLAYLLRNDILTNVENLRAELEYLIKNDDDVSDLLEYSDIATRAMKKYLNLVPPNELEEAKRILSSS